MMGNWTEMSFRAHPHRSFGEYQKAPYRFPYGFLTTMSDGDLVFSSDEEDKGDKKGGYSVMKRISLLCWEE
jgi:hypothetical protein